MAIKNKTARIKKNISRERRTEALKNLNNFVRKATPRPPVQRPVAPRVNPNTQRGMDVNRMRNINKVRTRRNIVKPKRSGF